MSRISAWNAARTLICVGSLWGLTGCAVVKIAGADGKEEVRFQPLQTVTIRPPIDGPQVVRIASLGISTTPRGVDVGLRNEDIVMAPAKCHAVLVVRSEAQAETAAKLAKMVDEGCVIRR